MATNAPDRVERSTSDPEERATGTSAGSAAGTASRHALDIITKALIMREISRLPEVRMEKIFEVKKQIERGEYETEEKIDITIDRILKEICG